MSLLTHANIMNSNDLWQMFKRTGDIEWYSLYRTMKEEESPRKD